MKLLPFLITLVAAKEPADLKYMYEYDFAAIPLGSKNATIDYLMD
jgi:hypothetical protein